MPGWGKLDFSAKSMETLGTYDKVVISAIHIESTEILLQGTRSQKLNGKAILISDSLNQTSPAMGLGKDFIISQYWPGAPLEKNGNYLVVLSVGEDQKMFNRSGEIIQWEKIEKRDDAPKRVAEEAKKYAGALLNRKGIAR